MEDKVISAVIKDRTAYDMVNKAQAVEDFSDKAKIIFQAINDYYQQDTQAVSVDTSILLARIERAYPKHYEQFRILVSNLPEVSSPNIINELFEVKKQALRVRLAAAFSQGKDDEAETLIESWMTYRHSGLVLPTSKAFIAPPVRELVEQTTGANRIKILPTVLNDLLDGGALRHHHIVVFARPETGKSLFALNMASGFLKQNLKTLYIGNEDPAMDMILRLIQRLSNMTKYEIRENPDKADALSRERNYENFIFEEVSPGTPHELREMAGDYKPDVIIIDQLRNLNVGEQHRVQQLERSATFARNLGKEFNTLMVSLTQAGESASGKLILDMGDVDSSNTGIPGACDLMIGIGVTDDFERQGMRMLAFPKNKISGNKQSLRVRFDPTLTKVL